MRTKFKKMISAMLSACMLSALAVMPAQAAPGVMVDATTFYADADGIEVKVTSGTLEVGDVEITTMDGTPVTVNSVTPGNDGVALIDAEIVNDTDYMITIGGIKRSFKIKTVVDGISADTFVNNDRWGGQSSGSKLIDDEYFIRWSTTGIAGAKGNELKEYSDYTLSYNYSVYSTGWGWGHGIVWNADTNAAAAYNDGYGLWLPFNTLKTDAFLRTTNKGTLTDTAVPTTSLYVNATGGGAAAFSAADTVSVTTAATKKWAMKLKKNGAAGTLYIEGNKIYTYDPGAGAATKGYLDIVQSDASVGSISDILITASIFTEIKEISPTEFYADMDKISLNFNDDLPAVPENTNKLTVEGPVSGVIPVNIAKVSGNDRQLAITPQSGMFPRNEKLTITVDAGFGGTLVSVGDLWTKDFKIIGLQEGITPSDFNITNEANVKVIGGKLYIRNALLTPKASHSAFEDYTVKLAYKPFYSTTASTNNEKESLYFTMTFNAATPTTADGYRLNLQNFNGMYKAIANGTSQWTGGQLASMAQMGLPGDFDGINAYDFDEGTEVGANTYSPVTFKIEKHGKSVLLDLGNKKNVEYTADLKEPTGYFTFGGTTVTTAVQEISDFMMTRCAIYGELERIGSGDIAADGTIQLNFYAEATTAQNGVTVFDEYGDDVTAEVLMEMSPDKSKMYISMPSEWKNGEQYTVKVASNALGVADPDWIAYQQSEYSFDVNIENKDVYVTDVSEVSGDKSAIGNVGIKISTENSTGLSVLRTYIATVENADGGVTGLETEADRSVAAGTANATITVPVTKTGGTAVKGYLLEPGTDGVVPVIASAGVTELDTNTVTISGNIGEGKNNRVVEAYITPKSAGTAVDDNMIWFSQTPVHSDGAYSFVFKFNGSNGEYNINVRNKDKLSTVGMNFVDIDTVKTFISNMCQGAVNVTPLDGSDNITTYVGGISYYAGMLGVDPTELAKLTTARDEALLKKRIMEAKTTILAEMAATPISFAKIAAVVDKAAKEVTELKAIEATEQWADIRGVAMADTSVLGLVFTDYNNLTDQGKQNVWGGLVGKTYADADVFKTSFDSLVTSNRGTGVYIPPTSSGGSSGGGGAYIPPVPQGNGDISGDEPKPSTSIGGYNDIASVDWAHESIKALSERGIISGVANGVFEPNRPIKREELIKMIVEAFGLTGMSDKQYNDVAPGSWYGDYISIAVYNGIINGVDDDRLGIGMDMSRQDLCTILYRAAQAAGIEFGTKNDSFSDNDSVTDYAADAVAYLSGSGIIDGVGDNLFDPHSFATRAQTAKILWGLLKLGGGDAK